MELRPDQAFFLAGFAGMALYLGFLQRSVSRVLYVFAPLFPCALAFAAYARATGAPLSIVHVMGFSLVIALALDYTAVAVSTDHRPLELSKVLLTGLCTLATFGVLVLARHPVMRELGVTVAETNLGYTTIVSPIDGTPAAGVRLRFSTP